MKDTEDKIDIPENPKCENCIHYWKRKGKKEMCTKEKGSKIISPCIYFED